MSGYSFLWITLLLLAVQHSRRAESFQCYECENCPTIEETDLKYLKECVLPDNFIVRPTTTVSSSIPQSGEKEDDLPPVPTSTAATKTSTAAAVTVTSPNASTSTSAAATKLPLVTSSTSAANLTDLEDTLAAQNGTDSDEDNDLGLPEDAEIQNTTEAEKQPTQASEGSATTKKKKKVGSWSLFSSSKEDADARSNEFDLSAEVSPRNSLQLPGSKPMCYVLTIKYDGYDITSRGCGVALPDRNLTCKMLSKGQPYSECGLCEGNKCNSASALRNAFVDILFVLVLIAVHSW